MKIKWEALLAMLGMLALGAWLIWSRPATLTPSLRDGATVQEIRLGNTRGFVEIVGDGDDATYRILVRGREPSPVLQSQHDVAEALAPTITGLDTRGTHPVLRVLNITTWASLPWIVIGFGAQAVFAGRFIVQWLVSERKRESVVPEAFWWLSLTGGAMLFFYFVWRQDMVGVMGQSTGLIIYARNLRLIAKQRRRANRVNANSAGPAFKPVKPALPTIDQQAEAKPTAHPAPTFAQPAR